jgi:31-O-methyltransferase
MSLVRRRLPNGLTVTQVDPGEAALLYREIFVAESYLRPGFPAGEPKVIFDIGANIGLAAIFFAQRFPGARVVAVEPGPDTYQALQANVAAHVPSGVARNVAVADRDGVARFGYYPGAPAESGLYVDQAGETELAHQLLVATGFTEADAARFSRDRHELSYLECETVTLSTLIRQTGVDTIDLLKVDVEKAELDVLAGIAEHDWPKIRQLVLEVHDIDDRLRTVRTMLTERGFTMETCQESRLAGTDMYMLFAARS